MAAALLLPRLLDHMPDRSVMLPAATSLGVILTVFAVIMFLSQSTPSRFNWLWPALLVTWTLLGIGYSAVMTPSGRLLRRSAQPSDRPAVFAAQFALSHACWLITYPIAGWLGSVAGIFPTLVALAAITFAGVGLAFKLWPGNDSEVVSHQHPDLSPDHPHLQAAQSPHAHSFVIDDLHHRWP